MRRPGGKVRPRRQPRRWLYNTCLVISIIIPTYNKSKNMPELLSAVDRIMSDSGPADYEVIVMDDDSPDGTAALVSELGIPKIRAVNRKGRPRGLAPAVMDGFAEAKGDVLCVMDADLSHPAEALPPLAEAVAGGAAIAVGSRYVKGGGVRNWPLRRRLASRAACLAANLVTPVRDSTSGFFMVRRSAMDGVVLTAEGFKIGLEVFVRARHGGRIREIPYVFKDDETLHDTLNETCSWCLRGSLRLWKRTMPPSSARRVCRLRWTRCSIVRLPHPDSRWLAWHWSMNRLPTRTRRVPAISVSLRSIHY